MARKHLIYPDNPPVAKYDNTLEDNMDIALETFKQPAANLPPENIGRSTVSIGEEGYLALSRLEQELQRSGQDELLLDADQNTIQLDAPIKEDELHDSKVRVFLDEDTKAAVFHLVARHSRDNSMIFTEPTMLRLIAI